MAARRRAEQAWHDASGLTGVIVVDAAEQAIAAERVEALEEAARVCDERGQRECAAAIRDLKAKT